jgi:hypothetical protein
MLHISEGMGAGRTTRYHMALSAWTTTRFRMAERALFGEGMALEKVVGCAQHRVYNAPYEAVVEKGTAVNAPLALVRGDLSPSPMPYGKHSRGQSRLTPPFSYEKSVRSDVVLRWCLNSGAQQKSL